MPKIVSRSDPENTRLQLLQEALLKHSHGAISKGAQGLYRKPGSFNFIKPVPLAEDLDGAITQVEQLLDSYSDTLTQAQQELNQLRRFTEMCEARIQEIESVLENLVGDVGYDDALDHATADLMDCLQASGAAEVRADGQLAFDYQVTFGKEELKPMLREAICRWIEVRLSN